MARTGDAGGDAVPGLASCPPIGRREDAPHQEAVDGLGGEGPTCPVGRLTPAPVNKVQAPPLRPFGRRVLRP